MSVEIDAVWVEIIIENVNYLCIDCVLPPSAHTEYYEKILDMLDNVDAEEKDNFIMGDLKFDYKLDESLGSNPLYYVENAYGYSQMFTEITRRPLIQRVLQWNLSITTTNWDTSLPSGAHLGDQGPPRWDPEGRNC